MRWVCLAAFLLLITAAYAAGDSIEGLPAIPREFRGVWVATVGGMDWPDAKATSDQQKAALIAILDTAARLHMNAVILQVRPSGDAFYASDLEPWSEYLTGKLGKAPDPFYDPLAFAVDEAHKRGLELHAWLNPFRSGYASARGSGATSHVISKHPELVKPYGRQQWMDPGEPDVRGHSMAVFLDVVKRYDIDGIHMDDYFYPYKSRGPDGRVLDFPDAASWAKYRAAGGKLSRDDWRRDNINGFVESLYKGVKQIKPWVKVGISPFGIWRPGNPAGVQGLDPYHELYADSRTWLQNGWLDYFTPQLYWATTAVHQPYSGLLAWWADQNPHNRNLWPGNILSHPAAEIATEIDVTRKQKGASGNVLFSARSLMRNRGGVADTIAKAYAQPALVPASPWLENDIPNTPTLTVDAGTATWSALGPGWLWAIRSRKYGAWSTQILPAGQTTQPVGDADIFTVTAVDRCGQESKPAVWSK